MSNLHKHAEEQETSDDRDGRADEGGGLSDRDAAVEASERSVEARVEPGRGVGVVELRLGGRVGLGRCNEITHINKFQIVHQLIWQDIFENISKISSA